MESNRQADSFRCTLPGTVIDSQTSGFEVQPDRSTVRFQCARVTGVGRDQPKEVNGLEAANGTLQMRRYRPDAAAGRSCAPMFGV